MNMCTFGGAILKIIKCSVEKTQLNSFLKIQYSNEIKVRVQVLIDKGFIDSVDSLNDLSEQEVTEIIRKYVNYNKPGTYLSKGKKGKHAVHKI